MNQLKEDIAAGLIDCVVIYKIDRVCSDMMDFCTFYSYLKEHEIKFITVQDGIDTTTPLGEAMMYLAVIFSGQVVHIIGDPEGICANFQAGKDNS